jgi:tetratricopeptide (TPR) repeat protein
VDPGSQNSCREREEKEMKFNFPKRREVQMVAGQGTDAQIEKQRPGFFEQVFQKKVPANAQSWNRKGNEYMQSGEYESAIRAYKRAIDLESSFGWPYGNLAFVYLIQDRLEEALYFYLKGMEFLNTDREKSVSWNWVGFIYRRRKDYHNAKAAYQKADELDLDNADAAGTYGIPYTVPDLRNPQFLTELGDGFFKKGSYKEAESAYQQAVTMDPSSGVCLSNLALALVFQGKYQEAVDYYQKSIPLFREDQEKAVIWNRLGDVYRKLNNYDNAISAYQTAIKLTNEPVNLLTRARFSLLGNCRVD